MVNHIEGNLVIKSDNARFCIVISRFNDFIGSKLLDGAIDTLVRHGLNKENIDVMWTPGAFEIPIVAKKAALTKRYCAIITLGAIIRGATAHFEYVASELSKGIANVALETGVPVTFGVLTTENIEQAVERAGTKAGNKGSEAALAAIETSNLLSCI